MDIAADDAFARAPASPAAAARPALDVKTLCHLISVLNTSFPDFDFSCVCAARGRGHAGLAGPAPSLSPPRDFLPPRSLPTASGCRESSFVRIADLVTRRETGRERMPPA
jgi:hypothetical protein